MTCSKSAYGSLAVARREARCLRDDTGEPFRAYRCGDCGTWHLATSVECTTIGQPWAALVTGAPRARTIEDLQREAREYRARRGDL